MYLGAKMSDDYEHNKGYLYAYLLDFIDADDNSMMSFPINDVTK